MTITINRAAAAAVIACASLASPALAQLRETVHAHVSRAGLDLTQPHDRAVFDSRLRRAAVTACVAKDRNIGVSVDELQCRAEMMRDGAQQVAALTGHRGTELASIGR